MPTCRSASSFDPKRCRCSVFIQGAQSADSHLNDEVGLIGLFLQQRSVTHHLLTNGTHDVFRRDKADAGHRLIDVLGVEEDFLAGEEPKVDLGDRSINRVAGDQLVRRFRRDNPSAANEPKRQKNGQSPEATRKALSSIPGRTICKPASFTVQRH